MERGARDNEDDLRFRHPVASVIVAMYTLKTAQT